MSQENTYKLSDSVIAHVAKALQVAIITGTDIVDNLRIIELTISEDKLVLTADCQENFEANLNSMMNDAENTSSNQESDQESFSDSPFSS